MVFKRVCSINDLADGGVVRFVREGAQAIAVCKSEGEVFAIADKCSHGNWSLAEGFLENCHLECILHGSAFDLRTGWPNKLPATKPVEVFEVKIEGESILVDIDSGHITQP